MSTIYLERFLGAGSQDTLVLRRSFIFYGHHEIYNINIRDFATRFLKTATLRDHISYNVARTLFVLEDGVSSAMYGSYTNFC